MLNNDSLQARESIVIRIFNVTSLERKKIKIAQNIWRVLLAAHFNDERKLKFKLGVVFLAKLDIQKWIWIYKIDDYKPFKPKIERKLVCKKFVWKIPDSIVIDYKWKKYKQIFVRISERLKSILN
jgi:hypothetical protein